MQKEQGICLGCGKETAGTPAKEDWVIRVIRKIRAFLSRPGKHTVACKECLPKLLEKRKKYEKNRLWYCEAGVLFFLLVVAIAALQNSLGLKAFLGAALGALLICAFSLLCYSPKFD